MFILNPEKLSFKMLIYKNVLSARDCAYFKG